MVFAVIKAWHVAGKQRTNAAGHDFRPWATTLELDYCAILLNAVPLLLDGHRETLNRMSDVALTGPRAVALAVGRKDKTDRWLRAHELVKIIDDSGGTTLPGLPEGGDLNDDRIWTAVIQGVGRYMAKCFGEDNVVTIDNFRIERKETYHVVHPRDTKEYNCASTPIAPQPEPAAHRTSRMAAPQAH